MSVHHTRLASRPRLLSRPGLPSGNGAAAPPRPRRLRWIEGATPDTEEARLVLEGITERGLATVEEVTRYVADILYWRDFLRGGWATDIGLLRPLDRREVRETLERLEGRCVRSE